MMCVDVSGYSCVCVCVCVFGGGGGGGGGRGPPAKYTSLIITCHHTYACILHHFKIKIKSIS